VDVAADAASDPDVSLGQVASAIGGRLVETVGVITGDDDLIAEGKTKHAEAMDGSDTPAS
jgi:hypothetical protein